MVCSIRLSARHHSRFGGGTRNRKDSLLRRPGAPLVLWQRFLENPAESLIELRFAIRIPNRSLLGEATDRQRTRKRAGIDLIHRAEDAKDKLHAAYWHRLF